ncbi:MAG: hypothetical protein KIH89_001285 [Candidatus Shapirobacteria bacterium]|nr:hypothetical protein [Candidatus Shapirobacteria bacterium]
MSNPENPNLNPDKILAPQKRGVEAQRLFDEWVEERKMLEAGVVTMKSLEPPKGSVESLLAGLIEIDKRVTIGKLIIFPWEGLD